MAVPAHVSERDVVNRKLREGRAFFDSADYFRALQLGKNQVCKRLQDLFWLCLKGSLVRCRKHGSVVHILLQTRRVRRAGASQRGAFQRASHHSTCSARRYFEQTKRERDEMN